MNAKIATDLSATHWRFIQDVLHDKDFIDKTKEEMMEKYGSLDILGMIFRIKKEALKRMSFIGRPPKHLCFLCEFTVDDTDVNRSRDCSYCPALNKWPARTGRSTHRLCYSDGSIYDVWTITIADQDFQAAADIAGDLVKFFRSLSK